MRDKKGQGPAISGLSLSELIGSSFHRYLARPDGAVDEIGKTDFGEHDAALNAEEVLEGFESLLVFY